ncbi:hypothetical protein MOQ26_23525, partial [Stenotrophomonas maltophilia]|nr:hypothetical protein [Stenotrophomonas maltophilia]
CLKYPIESTEGKFDFWTETGAHLSMKILGALTMLDDDCIRAASAGDVEYSGLYESIHRKLVVNLTKDIINRKAAENLLKIIKSSGWDSLLPNNT